MTQVAFKANVGAARDGSGVWGVSAVAATNDPLTAASTAAAAAPSITSVDGDVTTLVADGASPTQAHVTTLNTDWSAFKTALTTYNTDVTAAKTASFDLSSDVVLVVNKTNVGTMSKLKAVVNQLLKVAESSGNFTA